MFTSIYGHLSASRQSIGINHPDAVEKPRYKEAVEASAEDLLFDTEDSLFGFGHELRYTLTTLGREAPNDACQWTG